MEIETETFQNYFETETFDFGSATEIETSRTKTETFFISRPYVQTHSMCFNVTTRLASSLTYSFNNFNVLFRGIFFIVEGRHSKAYQLSLSSVLSFYRTVVCQSCLCFDITSPTSCGPSALISLIVPSSIKMVGIVDKLTC